jgi:hypothetical protein
LRKLAAMRTPEILNVHALCRDNKTSQGKDDRTEATVAPSPSRTRTDGNAQHSNVPSEVKSEK